MKQNTKPAIGRIDHKCLFCQEASGWTKQPEDPYDTKQVVVELDDGFFVVEGERQIRMEFRVCDRHMPLVDDEFSGVMATLTDATVFIERET